MLDGMVYTDPVDTNVVLFSNLKCSTVFDGIKIPVLVVAVVLKFTNAGDEFVAILTTFGTRPSKLESETDWGDPDSVNTTLGPVTFDSI
jgi:hypothetical protein